MKSKWTVLSLGLIIFGALPAEAQNQQRQAQTWVPQQAWRAVKQYAHQHFARDAHLFKTPQTKQNSRNLKGVATGQAAWIVGAQRMQNAPEYHFMPYLPRKAFFLATKNVAGKYDVTPLAGMGGYLSQVSATQQNPRVGVGVGLFTPGMVCHGVQVSNTTRLDVNQGQALAKKQNGQNIHTVYVKGAKPQQLPNQPIFTGYRANIRGYVPPVGWCGTQLPVNIPVNFTQVYF